MCVRVAPRRSRIRPLETERETQRKKRKKSKKDTKKEKQERQKERHKERKARQTIDERIRVHDVYGISA